MKNLLIISTLIATLIGSSVFACACSNRSPDEAANTVSIIQNMNKVIV